MLKKLDGQTNIDKYRGPTHKILQNIISEQNFDYDIKKLKYRQPIMGMHTFYT